VGGRCKGKPIWAADHTPGLSRLVEDEKGHVHLYHAWNDCVAGVWYLQISAMLVNRDSVTEVASVSEIDTSVAVSVYGSTAH
jgi:hypothetical protein